MATETTPPPTRHDDAALRDWLATRDAPCPVCEYNLRGLTTTECPECRTDLRLTVGVRRPRDGPWLLALISVAMGLGFDSVVGLMFSGAALVSLLYPPTPWQPFALASSMWILALTCIGCISYLIRTRDRFLSRSRVRRRILAAAWFLGVGLGHALAGLLIAMLVN